MKQHLLIAVALPALTLAGCADNDPASDSVSTPPAASEDAEPNPAQAARADGWHHYGSEVESGDEVDAGHSVALASLDGGETGVIITGQITEVCQTSGCWMSVTDDDQSVFVKFVGYSFFVPRNAAGHRVVARGQAVAEEVSVEELRHYAEDAGQSADQIALITEPETRITFVADSIYIEGDGLDEPIGHE